MKYLIFILPLLVACESGSSGSNKNDGEVIPMCIGSIECGRRNTLRASVSQDVTTNVAISGYELTLSSLLPTRSPNADECGPNPTAGKIYTYDIKDDVLTIDDNRVTVSYQRVDENNVGILGKWKLKSSSDKLMRSGSVEFPDYRTIHFIHFCSN